jgi:hypothetical protein
MSATRTGGCWRAARNGVEAPRRTVVMPVRSPGSALSGAGCERAREPYSPAVAGPDARLPRCFQRVRRTNYDVPVDLLSARLSRLGYSLNCCGPAQRPSATPRRTGAPRRRPSSLLRPRNLCIAAALRAATAARPPVGQRPRDVARGGWEVTGSLARWERPDLCRAVAPPQGMCLGGPSRGRRNQAREGGCSRLDCLTLAPRANAKARRPRAVTIATTIANIGDATSAGPSGGAVLGTCGCVPAHAAAAALRH